MPAATSGPPVDGPAVRLRAEQPELEPRAGWRASTPGALRREDAALYCGVSASTWDEWRVRGLAPDPLPPVRDASGRVRILQWATAHLDLWLMHGRPERAKFRAILDRTRRAER